VGVISFVDALNEFFKLSLTIIRLMSCSCAGASSLHGFPAPDWGPTMAPLSVMVATRHILFAIFPAQYDQRLDVGLRQVRL